MLFPNSIAMPSPTNGRAAKRAGLWLALGLGLAVVGAYGVPAMAEESKSLPCSAASGEGCKWEEYVNDEEKYEATCDSGEVTKGTCEAQDGTGSCSGSSVPTTTYTCNCTGFGNITGKAKVEVTCG